MQNEVGDWLDREILSRTQQTSTPGVRFTNVMDQWSDQEPYDSDAAYTAAHAHLLLPRGPLHPHPPTLMALLTRISVHGHKIAALPILIATLAHAEQKPTVILSVLGSMDLPLHTTGLP